MPKAENEVEKRVKPYASIDPHKVTDDINQKMEESKNKDLDALKAAEEGAISAPNTSLSGPASAPTNEKEAAAEVAAEAYKQASQQ